MILAAGRGERMRPLSDATPKPLLEAGGKPLIVWQIESLVRAGFTSIVINASHLADVLVARIGDGRGYGAAIRWSLEPEALETAGGIATALPLLPAGPLLVVSGDIWTAYDYARLVPRLAAIERDSSAARAHLVMVPNPSYHREGDFGFAAGGRLALQSEIPLTFGNIALYDRGLFAELPPHTKLKLFPLFCEWIDRGIVDGERYDGPWANVGTPADLAELDAALRARSQTNETER